MMLALAKKILRLCINVLAWVALVTTVNAQERPNFLFILSEDMGAQMGALGTPELRTPRLDALAHSGVIFDRAFITSPTCSPSKASIMTSQYPHTNNLRINVHEYVGPTPDFTDAQFAFNQKLAIVDSMPTLIEKLERGGYRTGLMHKFHVTPHDKFPYSAWNTLHHADEVVDFIEENHDSPWFLLVVFGPPHRPFANHQRGEIPDPDKLELPAHLPDTPTVRNDWAAYLRAIQKTDIKVGQTLDALEQSGKTNETIILFMGDHGPAYHRAKNSPYDFGLHVPLIITGPAALVKQRPQAVSELVSSVDLMPTVLDYAGIEIPSGLQGLSLRPILEGSPGAKGHDYIFGEVHHGAPDPAIALQERSVYDGRYRLIFRDHQEQVFKQSGDNIDHNHWGNPVYAETIARRDTFPDAYRMLAERDSSQPGQAPRFELYDLQNDPWEIDNRYGQAGQEAITCRLTQALLDWVVDTGDRYVDAGKLEAALTDRDDVVVSVGGNGGSGGGCFMDTTGHLYPAARSR